MTSSLPLLLISLPSLSSLPPSLPSQEATDQEHVIIQRQNQEEEVRRQQAEQRMNRWYNRLLGRHQDDPVSTGQSLITLGKKTHKAVRFVPQLVLARRRRNRPPRPNIGQALAGLAREQPPGESLETETSGGMDL